MASPVQDEKSIFLHAIECASIEERLEFLSTACSGSPDLRAGVDRLLQAYDNPHPMLRDLETQQPAMEASVAERAGTVIGPYKLLQQIGEGGMGVVFMAEQSQPVRRKVALKIIKPGMDSRQVIARFEAERQALAMMDHPNIAKVFDAGTTGGYGRRESDVIDDTNLSRLSQDLGRPFFVMELVRGTAITRFCDQHKLSTRERLELLITVCGAIQHAHQKGIIHRDLKPGNILVELHDVTAVPKVIDFGVAKATNAQLTERTLFTDFAQLIGTPLYMSPEQAELSGLDVDTRSDIYSLGVLLYELLAGSTPFDQAVLKKAGYDEMRRMIREDEPLRPSVRISTLNAQALSTLAQQHGVEQRRLQQTVRGELDWIVMKCLEKDRNRRYESASALAADLRRYLADEPVQACPPSIIYRVKKFIQRNQGLVVAVSVVLLAMMGGIVGTTWGLIRAENSRKSAETARAAEAERAKGERLAKEDAQKRTKQVEKAAEILASVFQDFDPQVAEQEGVTFRVLLGRRLLEAVEQLDGEAVGDPLVTAKLQHVLGVSLHELGHRDHARRLLKAATDTRQRLLGADSLETAATKHHLAMVKRDQAECAEAEVLYKEALQTRTAQLGSDHPDTLTTRHFLALVYLQLGNHPAAAAMLKEVLTARTRVLGHNHRDTLTTQHRLAQAHRQLLEFDKARELCQQVLDLRTSTLGTEHLDTVASKQLLGLLQYSQQKYDSAEALLKEVLTVRKSKLGVDHPDTLGTQHNLAMLYQEQGKHDLAEAMYRDLLSSRTAKLGADHPDTMSVQESLATLYEAQLKYDLAESLYKEVLAASTAKLGPDHLKALSSMSSLAQLYYTTNRLDEAIPLFEESFRRYKAKLGPDHLDTVGAQIYLAVNYCEIGRYSEAIALLEPVRRREPANAHLGWVGERLIVAYAKSGQATKAADLAMQRMTAARDLFPKPKPELAGALDRSAGALIEVKAYAAAEPLLLECIAIRQPDHVYPELIHRLASLYDGWGKPDEAAKWRKKLEDQADVNAPK